MPGIELTVYVGYLVSRKVRMSDIEWSSKCRTFSEGKGAEVGHRKASARIATLYTKQCKRAVEG